MKTILADDLVREINLNDLLAARAEEDGRISVQYLGKCGNETVGWCIERVYKSEWLRFVEADESASVAWYAIDGGEICEPCEGGVVAFESESERRVWLSRA